MKTLFLVLVTIFQFLGCLQPVQSMVQVAMSTGLVHNPQTVFICLALAIIVFAVVVKFVPGFAGPFQKFEDYLKGIKDNLTGASQANTLTSQVQSIAADVALIKSLVIPSQGVIQNPDNLDALATGQTIAAAVQAAPPAPAGVAK